MLNSEVEVGTSVDVYENFGDDYSQLCNFMHRFQLSHRLCHSVTVNKQGGSPSFTGWSPL